MYTYTVAGILIFFSSLRGLVLDTQKGNILKIDKDGFILRLVLKLCATKPFAVSGMASVFCHLLFPQEQDIT